MDRHRTPSRCVDARPPAVAAATVRRTARRGLAVALTAAGLATLATAPAVAQNRVDQRAGGAERVTPPRVEGAPPVTGPGAPGGPLPGQPGSRPGQYADQSASQFRGGQNPIVVDPGAEFRRRNAVITGNAPGGRNFRGVVGYSSPFDFRGTLGSDDLFGFRSETLYSDPRLIQAAPNLRYGSALGQLEVYRSGRGAVAADVQDAGVSSRRRADLQQQGIAFDPRLSELRRLVDATALEASLDRVVSQATGPLPVGMVRTQATEQPRALDASDLTGLQVRLADSDLAQFGVPMAVPLADAGLLSPMDQARLLEDVREGRPISPVGGVFSDTFVDTRIDADDLGDRMDAQVPSTRVGEPREADSADSIPAWQRIREEIARRYASEGRGGDLVDGMPTEEELRELEQDLDQLRRGLGATPGAAPDPDRRDRPAGPADDLGGPDPDAEAEDPPPADPLDVLRMGRTLRHGERISSLVSPEDRSRAGELIGEAEQQLRAGEYFRAERTFTRALRLVPGHPTATVGLAHSRLGAGLYIPAAMVLRDLFTFQPEMIGATYADELVPNRPRLLRALETVRNRIGQTDDDADNGLMLAYIGRLLEREGIVVEGLGVMRAADADDPLLPLLAAVWAEGVVIPEAGGDESDERDDGDAGDEGDAGGAEDAGGGG